MARPKSASGVVTTKSIAVSISFRWKQLYLLLDKCVKSVYRASMSSREVIQRLKQDGWYEVAHVGSHKQFKHPVKPGRVTLPHPVRDIPIGTLRSIEKQAGIRLR